MKRAITVSKHILRFHSQPGYNMQINDNFANGKNIEDPVV